MVKLGVDNLVNNKPACLKDKRLGLLCNQASVNADFVHSRHLIEQAFPGQLTCLFSPQHGFFAEKQDNMVESAHSQEKGLQVYSLYGDTRRPSADMLADLDVLLVDLLDVGTRVYTFMSTLAYCLDECALQGKKVVVLDRPNPIGGEQVEGNIISDEWKSFVGLYSLPMRHGLTFAELALFINDHLAVQADLEIIKMQGWKRQMLFPDTGLPWVYPSPNLPTYESTLVYPGQVCWEGTNVSEGRGTTLPFELIGAPYLNHDKLLGIIGDRLPPGVVLRPICFEPTSNKWANNTCIGFHLHVTDPLLYKPYLTTLVIMQAIMTGFADEFALKKPPYEYEYEKTPLDLILGDRQLRIDLENGADIVELEKKWRPELEHFASLRKAYFLYD